MSFAIIETAQDIEKEILTLEESITEHENMIREYHNQTQSYEKKACEMKKVDADSTYLVNNVISAISCEGIEAGIADTLVNISSSCNKKSADVYDATDYQLQKIETDIKRKREEIEELKIRLEIMKGSIPY